MEGTARRSLFNVSMHIIDTNGVVRTFKGTFSLPGVDLKQVTGGQVDGSMLLSVSSSNSIRSTIRSPARYTFNQYPRKLIRYHVGVDEQNIPSNHFSASRIQPIYPRPYQLPNSRYLPQATISNSQSRYLHFPVVLMMVVLELLFGIDSILVCLVLPSWCGRVFDY